MNRRRWARRLQAELQSDIDRGARRLDVEIPARRAGVARRRVKAVATWLKPHGYFLRTVDPTRRPATGGWHTATFERGDN